MSKRAIEAANRYGRQVNLIEAARQIIEEQKRNKQIVSDVMDQSYVISAFPRKSPDGQLEFKNCLIVTDSNELQVMQWGLVPGWIHVKGNKPEDIEAAQKLSDEWRQKTLNARAETIFEKKTYSEPVLKRRCLIPSTGYFEFHHNPDKSTTPHFIFLNNEDIFSIAGIWNESVNPVTKEKIQMFSLITTEANPMTKEIHNGGSNPGRMPLILSSKDEEKWIDPSLKESDIKSLLKTFPETNMEAYLVSKKFNHMDPHNQEIIKKVG